MKKVRDIVRVLSALGNVFVMLYALAVVVDYGILGNDHERTINFAILLVVLSIFGLLLGSERIVIVRKKGEIENGGVRGSES